MSKVPVGSHFLPNHYVPLVNRKKNKRGNKRKLKVSEPSLKKNISTLSFPKPIAKQTKLNVAGGMLSTPTLYSFFDTKDSKLKSFVSTSSSLPSSSIILDDVVDESLATSSIMTSTAITTSSAISSSSSISSSTAMTTSSAMSSSLISTSTVLNQNTIAIETKTNSSEPSHFSFF